MQDFAVALQLACLASSGLLLWEDVPQLALKFVFVSHRNFFLIAHCLLQKQRLGS